MIQSSKVIPRRATVVADRGQTPGEDLRDPRDAAEAAATMEDVQRMAVALERLNRQRTALRQIGQALAATLDLREIYRVTFHEIAQGLLGAPHLTMALFDRATETIRYGFAIVDGEEIDAARLPRIPLGEGLVSDAIRTRRPRIVDLRKPASQLLAGGHAAQVGDERQPQSALYVPMIAGDDVVGVMNVQHDEADAFCEADLPLICVLASQVAAAIVNARLFEAERGQRVIAEALRDTASAFNSTLNFDEVLDRILTNVGRVVPHDFADVLLVEGGIARIARSRGAAERDLEEQFLARRFIVADVPILRQMSSTGESLVIADTQGYPGWIYFSSDREVRSYAGTPIRLKGLIVGFLNLYSGTPEFFTIASAQRLQIFADQVAIAVANAHLYGTVERHSVELEQRVIERTRELAEANEQLKELDRLKDKFISNVSHELRTPLTNIRLYLGLLDHGRSEKRDQYMQTLHREAGRLTSLIEDLLELSRLDLGSARINLESTDLNALMAELVGDRSAMASELGLVLDCQLDPTAPPVVGDPGRIIQIMTNLLANAMNYTPRGGLITLSIELRQTQEGDWVTFTVQDTGPGISSEELPSLFARFFRGEASRQSSMPGSGLGLAICKELVEKMEGRITVESRQGHGAAFTVWLKPADTS